MMPAERSEHEEFPPGALEMLVLRVLNVQSLHGYGIAQQIEKLSDAVLRIEQGSLYPALDRLQRQGWITGKWGVSPTGRRARYYTITDRGRTQLGERLARFARLNTAIDKVLKGT